ncbi:MAG TPA: hypothetical protein DCQ84_05555 [Candidatus Competibacteraceae bacterium]|nr:hypothetical protein [Candidatus Competibacteraceae bacterium]
MQTLYAEHVARLQEAGFSDKGALVHRHDYWRVLHKAQVTTDAVFDLLDQGRVRTQAEGLYWVPEDAA